MNDDGISLDKRSVGLGKAHLELLVAACRKFLWCINFAVSPNSWKMQKMSSLKIKGYTVILITWKAVFQIVPEFATWHANSHVQVWPLVCYLYMCYPFIISTLCVLTFSYRFTALAMHGCCVDPYRFKVSLVLCVCVQNTFHVFSWPMSSTRSWSTLLSSTLTGLCRWWKSSWSSPPRLTKQSHA